MTRQTDLWLNAHYGDPAKLGAIESVGTGRVVLVPGAGVPARADLLAEAA